MKNGDFKLSAIYNLAPAEDRKAFDEAAAGLEARSTQFASLTGPKQMKLMPLSMRWKIMRLKVQMKQPALEHLFSLDPGAAGQPLSGALLRVATRALKSRDVGLLCLNTALIMANSVSKISDRLKHPKRYKEEDPFERLLASHRAPLSVEQLNAAQARLEAQLARRTSPKFQSKQ